jgi:hypothetical protein
VAVGSHIIPKFYLDQFSVPSSRKRRKGPANLVWVYQKNKTPAQRATVIQGAENGYFAFVKPDGTRDESFETRLADLEGDCGDTLVLAASPFFDLHSASRHNTLAFYAALFFCRATQRRSQSEKTYRTIWQEFSEAIADADYIAELSLHYSRKANRHVSAKEIRTILTKLAESQMSDPGAMRNGFIDELLFVTESIKIMLLQKPWQIWRAPGDAEFVTSDNPVVTFLPLSNGAWSPGHGFRNPRVVALFPVAPCACLAMGNTGTDSGTESQTLDASQIAKVNELVIRLCDRFVYSKTFSAEIQKLVDSCAGSTRYGETAFLLPGRPTVKEFIRKQLGLDTPSASSAG